MTNKVPTKYYALIFLTALIIVGISSFFQLYQTSDDSPYGYYGQSAVEMNSRLLEQNIAYKRVIPMEKNSALNTLRQTAQERKAIMLDIAKNNPSAFIEQAMSSQQRAAFPKEVQKDIEEQMVLRDYKTVDEYFITNEKEKLEVYFPQKLKLPFGATVNAEGFRLDGNFVVISLSVIAKPELEPAIGQTNPMRDSEMIVQKQVTFRQNTSSSFFELQNLKEATAAQNNPDGDYEEYIIEFKDKPLIEKKAELEKEFQSDNRGRSFDSSESKLKFL